jgi:diketogulonate reductase-like aldo/keto reductase
MVENYKKNENELLEQEKLRRNNEDKLVDLALEWNYFDGVLPILQARQGEMVKKKYDFMQVKLSRN